MVICQSLLPDYKINLALIINRDKQEERKLVYINLSKVCTWWQVTIQNLTLI